MDVGFKKREYPELTEYCQATGKLCYLTYEQAAHVINYMKGRSGGHAHYSSRGKKSFKKICKRVYHCPDCNYWHTTSKA